MKRRTVCILTLHDLITLEHTNLTSFYHTYLVYTESIVARYGAECVQHHSAQQDDCVSVTVYTRHSPGLAWECIEAGVKSIITPHSMRVSDVTFYKSMTHFHCCVIARHTTSTFPFLPSLRWLSI
ncbi:MAG: hypothetical protein OXC30_03500 [Alphaproteobacteria bacterium]|nr:hypothetical protein [Alphaproteobacteria bacterium]